MTKHHMQIWLLAFGFVTSASALELTSPNGNFLIKFEVGENGHLHYSLAYKSKPLLARSRLGLELDNASLSSGFVLVGETRSQQSTSWKPIWGERSIIPDRYNQMMVSLQQTSPSGQKLQLTFRAYDEGVAFCYTVPKQAGLESVTITREFSQFKFTRDFPAWVTYRAQGLYEKIPLSTVKPGCERPLVVEMGQELFAALGEAWLVDYARMKFRVAKGEKNTLEAFLDDDRGRDTTVHAATPFTSPWRFVMAAESPGQLLENNYLLLNLNEPCALADTSWIKPGKVIREASLTTAGGKACVDFAVRRGLQYIEYDAGWYGEEGSPASDATRVNLDPKRSKGPLNLQEVLRYAKSKGVGVLLYVNHIALEKQLDQILPLYRKWGVKGIKFGFVNVGSQKWTAWLHEAVRKCSTNHMLVDVHDEYRPTGYSRTYPNFLTMEGIRGDETSPANTQTLATAFTRMLAGPADNTVCYYDPRVKRLATHVYQLAKPVCLFSPFQFLFWYDRPNRPDFGKEPELEFWNAVPTTWDETRIISGVIGEHIITARRSGGEWFIGCMHAGPARLYKVPLDFLPANQAFAATIYTDDPDARTTTQVRISRSPRLQRDNVLELPVSANGGAAVKLERTKP